MLTSFTLAGPIGIEARPVTIQCSIDATKPSAFHVDGVSPTQSKEIYVRVRSAILASGLCAWPEGRVAISVNAHGAKLQAAALDLPITLAIAGVDTSDLLVAGELGLDGAVRAVRGVAPAVLLAQSLGLRGVLIPSKNSCEALEVLGAKGTGVLGAKVTVVHALAQLSEVVSALTVPATAVPSAPRHRQISDFAEVRGQSAAVETVARAVKERADLLLCGAPGTGKTMIARRIPGLLPALRRDEQVAVTCVYSATGLADGLITERPFRAPHHTIGAAALVGGGSSPRPGEVQLAAHGVLFLDEVVEFSRGAIEALASALDQMPKASRPRVVASANPCPCGWRDSGVRTCSCTDDTVSRYSARLAWVKAKLGLSICAAVRPLSLNELRGEVAGESTATIAGRIAGVEA